MASQTKRSTLLFDVCPHVSSALQRLTVPALHLQCDVVLQTHGFSNETDSDEESDPAEGVSTSQPASPALQRNSYNQAGGGPGRPPSTR